MSLVGREKGEALMEAWASRKNRRKDGSNYMERVGDDCSKEAILVSGDQSQKGKAIRRDVAHAYDP